VHIDVFHSIEYIACMRWWSQWTSRVSCIKQF